jgi:peptide/nickel transport system permease protein
VTRTFGAFVARRTAAALAFVFVVSTMAFVLARLAPGDETSDDVLAGVDAATIARTRARLGIDDPVHVQLGRWLGGLVTLDLGMSSRFDRPVTHLVLERGAQTAMLAAVVLLVATGVGLPAGILTGAHARRRVARVVGAVSITLASCPPMVGALGLLWIAVATGWLPTGEGSWAVPVLALAVPIGATIERLQHTATIDALGAPDLTAAAARGIPPTRLLWRHAARQSLRPVLGIYGVIIGGLFSGSLAVELVTSWPGLARLLYEAVMASDVALVSGCVAFGALCLALGNLVADVLRVLADPRVLESR